MAAAFTGGEITATWVPQLWMQRFGIAGIAGLMAGSYVFAETSDHVSATIQNVGSRGRIMLPDLIGMRVTVFLVLFVPLLAVAAIMGRLIWGPHSLGGLA